MGVIIEKPITIGDGEILEFYPVKFNLQKGKAFNLDDSIVLSSETDTFEFFCLGYKTHVQPKYGTLIGLVHKKEVCPKWIEVYGVACVEVLHKEGAYTKVKIQEMPFSVCLHTIAASNFLMLHSNHNVSVKLKRNTSEADFSKRKILVKFESTKGVKGTYYLAKFSFAQLKECDQDAFALQEKLLEYKAQGLIKAGKLPVVYKDEAEFNLAMTEKASVVSEARPAIENSPA